MNKKVTSNAGFTLLEVLMVSIILFFLAYTVFVSVRQTVDMKENIDQRTASLQEVRALLGLLQRDLEQATYNLPQDLTWNPRRPANPETEDSPPIPPPPEPISIFRGSSDSLFFSTATHQRTFQNARENEQHFVLYQVADEQLKRSESARAVSFSDREDISSYKEFSLLENIRQVKFEFYNPRSNQWETSWDTEKSDHKNLLPSAVKFLIEFEPSDPKIKELIGTQRILSAIRLGEDIFKNNRKTQRQGDSNNATIQ